MKPGFAVGATRTRRYDMDEERTISFMGEDMRIYSTPFMVRDIERTCREFMDEYLTPEENTVGARMEIEHLGPTLKGMWVEVTATVTSIEARRVGFEVQVRDALDVVGKAKHLRFVVDLAKQRERLQAKAARVAAFNQG